MLRARTRLGTVLNNKWRLDEVLGIGGMGSVFAATHRNGSRAAIKILHAELSSNTAVARQFLSEGCVANAIGHTGVVKILDEDESDDGSLFLVAELLLGETLDGRRMRVGGRMGAYEVLSISDQILDILSAAHAHGVVHRDLKPANVFLTCSGQVKLFDFGIARIKRTPGSTSRDPGTIMGTPAFMAPEHASGHEDEIDERSDLWSCGALMFNLLSGVLVHDGKTTNEQLVSAMTKRAPPIRSVAPDVTHSVARVVDRALAFEKRCRWLDAASMQEAVRDAYRETPVLLRPAGARKRARKGQWAIAAGLAAVTVLLLSVSVAGARMLQSTRPRAAEYATTVGGPKRVAFTPGELAAPNGLLPTTRTAATEQTRQTSPTSPTSPTREWVVNPSKVALTTLGRLSWPEAASPPSAQRPTIPSGVNCDPPFYIDVETGKKRWLLKCL